MHIAIESPTGANSKWERLVGAALAANESPTVPNGFVGAASAAKESPSVPDGFVGAASAANDSSIQPLQYVCHDLMAFWFIQNFVIQAFVNFDFLVLRTDLVV